MKKLGEGSALCPSEEWQRAHLTNFIGGVDAGELCSDGEVAAIVNAQDLAQHLVQHLAAQHLSSGAPRNLIGGDRNSRSLALE